MRCSNCGAEDQNGKFCVECGVKLTGQSLWDDVVDTSDDVEEKAIEDVERVKKEHAEVDMLISKLMKTKSQKKRQKILQEYRGEISTVDTKIRFEKLQEKVNRKVPMVEKINYWFGIGALIAFVIYMVEVTAFDSISTLGLICALWASAGFWIWPTWKLILILKRKKPWHYLNISDI